MLFSKARQIQNILKTGEECSVINNFSKRTKRPPVALITGLVWDALSKYRAYLA